MTTTPRADQLKALRALRNIGVTVGSERWPTPQDVIAGSKEAQANILHKARSDLVRKYRANPTSWPDGIDHKGNRWYKPEEWDDQGKWIAPYKAPWLTAWSVPKENAPEMPVEKPSPEDIAAAIRTAVANKTDSLKPIHPTDSPESIHPDSPKTDSPDSHTILSLASSGASIRDITKALNLSIGKVQRTLARARTPPQTTTLGSSL